MKKRLGLFVLCFALSLILPGCFTLQIDEPLSNGTPEPAPTVLRPAPTETVAGMATPTAVSDEPEPTPAAEESAVNDGVPKGSAITEADFVITLHNEELDLRLTTPEDLENLFGGGWEEQIADDGVYFEKKTASAVFTYAKGGPEIIDTAELGEDAKTARGIRLGSSGREMLLAYPEPKYEEREGGNVTYTFFVNPNKAPTGQPKSWYILDISVDTKSDTVCGIKFIQTFV